MSRRGETRDRVIKKKSIFEILVPVLTLMTIANCIVILVLVMNIGRKVNRLEQQILLIQDETKNALVNEQELALSDISDIDGNAVDAEEAADIAAVELQENTHKWDGKGDSSNGIRRVYLTFDDGPSANTDRILDILAQYGVKATFFVVGKEGYADQYRRIVEDGHTLAMHSYSHRYNEVYASLDSYKADLKKLHDYLYELTGVDCRFVRFPGGSSNTVSTVSMWDLIDYLDSEDMVYFDWNVSSGDSTGGKKSVEQLTSNVLDNIGKYNNAVVLFHDAAGKTTTVDALAGIIEKILESDNTVLLPISEDTVKVQHLHQ
ncbi:MAG: polysaccharide deacetylase [Lachnospiraceae bacterium]|nr:polysaccharide deacetylase [Lachnospiraceae bacterium]